MRVLQLIDSLHPGGAERIAVTFANALSTAIARSYLCTTREEGLLKEELSAAVGYHFLDKKAALDVEALRRLIKIVKEEQIDVIHAHTTSYFFATLLKIAMPRVRLVWHEHQGNRVHGSRRNNIPLVFCSFFFSKILTVNTDLQEWCKAKLMTKEVNYLSNFVAVSEFQQKAVEREKTIICVANLKTPKNHLNLLRAFSKVHAAHPDWQLQLVGKDFQDAYSQELHTYCAATGLMDHVQFLGSLTKVRELMSKASIGVLSSDDEGLPMVLLEYGASGLAVVATQVGYCQEVISTFGKIVRAKNSEELGAALSFYVSNREARDADGSAYNKHIGEHYSLQNVLPQLLKYYS